MHGALQPKNDPVNQREECAGNERRREKQSNELNDCCLKNENKLLSKVTPSSQS